MTYGMSLVLDYSFPVAKKCESEFVLIEGFVVCVLMLFFGSKVFALRVNYR